MTDDQEKALQELAKAGQEMGEWNAARPAQASAPTEPATPDSRRYLTLVLRDATRNEAIALLEHPKLSAASWSHALHDRDTALAQASAPSVQVTDQWIEDFVTKHGGRWGLDYWVIEDADLHPMIRALASALPAAQQPAAASVASWHPLTPELLAQIEHGPTCFWVYAPTLRPQPFIGDLGWSEYHGEHIFEAGGLEIQSKHVTHVMPFTPPAPPSA